MTEEKKTKEQNINNQVEGSDLPQEMTQSYGTGVHQQSGITAGGKTIETQLNQRNATSPELTGGDVDAYWQGANAVGDEAVGGTVATPDKNITEELGKELSHEEQLQLQRDLINKADTVHTRQYGGMSDTTKLLFWYRLAQGMDAHTVIPMPSNYEISSQSKEIIEKIKPLDFGVQMSLFRDYVAPMGAEPKPGSAV